MCFILHILPLRDLFILFSKNKKQDGEDRIAAGYAGFYLILTSISLCLCGCIKSDPWSVKHIETCMRLYYQSEDKGGGIDIEMLKTENRLTTYLQVRSGMLETEKAKIFVDGQEYLFIVERHRGGQRFNVPQEMQQLMLDCLSKEKSFILKLAGYQEQVEPGNFKKKFESSGYSIPFHLPF